MRRLLSIICLLLVSVTTVYAGDPSQISGLDGWWRADTGVTTTSGFVSQWNDQTATAANLTQGTAANRPAYINGGAQYAAVSGEYYTYSVGQQAEFLTVPVALSTNQQAFSFFAVVDWNTVDVTSLIFGAPASTTAYLYDAGGFLAFNNGTAKISTLRLPSSRCLVGVTATGTSTVLYLNQNSWSSSSVFSVATVTGGYIGSWNSGVTTYPLRGNILAMFHCNRAISATDETNLLDYCARTYSVGTAPNVNVVFDGDSITAGQGTSLNASYVKQMNLPNNYQYYDWGVSGQQLSTMTTNAATNIDPNYDSTKDYNICVIFGGTNDISSTVGNQTGATAYSRLVTYCQARKSAGWKVVVVSMLPRTGNGGSGGAFETDRTTFNNSLRANWSTFADALADVGGDAVMGNTSTLTNTAYFGADQTHPTVTGASIIARYVNKAINSIVNPSTIIPSPSRF